MGLGKTLEAISLIVHRPEHISDPLVKIEADEETAMGASSRAQSPSDAASTVSTLAGAISPLPAPTTTNTTGKRRSNAHPHLERDRYMVDSTATLIVCPLSTVANWEDQIAQHVIRGSVKVYVYHGPARRSDPYFLSKYDIVLTTYNLLSLEYTREIKSMNAVAKVKGKGKDDRAKRAGNESTLHRVRWKRVILYVLDVLISHRDEAHVIKDSNTGQARSACELVTPLRWCLTGIHTRLRITLLCARYTYPKQT